MPFIADVSFERPDKAEGDKFRFVRIGSIWYDSGKDKRGPSASVLLQAVRIGSFVARPRNQDDAPYLEGDMCVKTGSFEESGVTKNKYMNVGFIQTKEGQGGITYFGQILCDPSPLLTLSRVKEMMSAMISAKTAGQHFDLDAFSMNGIFVPVFLADRNRGVGEDNMPF